MKRIFIVEQPLKRLPGIYKITCEDSDKIYIGESVNISLRIQKHFSLLRHNKHSNQILQNMFNKYGEDFNFRCTKYPKNKKEFLNFTINPSPTLNKRVWGKLEDWYNGLLNSNNKKDIERLTNFKRGCIDSALEARNKIEWIKIIEKVLNQLPD